jgi:SAM-dependent methyltransferase
MHHRTIICMKNISMIRYANKMNDYNVNFYNNLGIAPFKLLAEAGGFNTFSDLEIAYPYVQNAGAILELGAGYGRCIDFLLERKYSGKIIAVERNARLAHYLKKNYTHKAEIIQDDIKSFDLKYPVDAALWMWSGFVDFSEEEQRQSIKRIYDLLSEQGKLLIDVPRIGFPTIATHHDEKYLVLESQYGTLKCYVPDRADMENYACSSGFAKVSSKHYLTSTQKHRTLFILYK